VHRTAHGLRPSALKPCACTAAVLRCAVPALSCLLHRRLQRCTLQPTGLQCYKLNITAGSTVQCVAMQCPVFTVKTNRVKKKKEGPVPVLHCHRQKKPRLLTGIVIRQYVPYNVNVCNAFAVAGTGCWRRGAFVINRSIHNLQYNIGLACEVPCLCLCLFNLTAGVLSCFPS
jgi:hypothetical protein